MLGFFRLRRSKQIIPGLRVNLSKSGVSLSAGVRGAHYTVGPRGRRTTVGLPGTGISYTSYSSHHARRAAEVHAAAATGRTPPATPRASASAMTPGSRLGWGIVLAVIGLLLVIPLWPIGLVLIAVGVWMFIVGLNQRKEPKWQIRSLLSRANAQPGVRGALLEQALQIDPENPEALAASAENAFRGDDWQTAIPFFERYLAKAPEDAQAQLHLGFSYLNAGDVDRALQRLEPVRATYGVNSTPTGLANAVATAFLKKNDPAQALEILKTLPLRRQTLDGPQQQSLFLRALAHYQLRQKSSAITDLDRLYALNPSYPDIDKVRGLFHDGSFDLNAVQFKVDASG